MAGRSLNEVIIDLEHQHSAKEDFIAPARGMRMQEDGTTFEINHLKTGEKKQFESSKVLHNQIGAALKIPGKYYELMRNEKPELLSRNINTWFADMEGSYMVRSFQYPDESIGRAMLSTQYRRIDNLLIAETVLPMFAGTDQYEVVECEVTERKLYFKIVNHRLQSNVVPGDAVQAGVIVTNSEVGLGAVSVRPYLYRLVCTNGMVVTEMSQRKAHIGRVQEAVNDGFGICSLEAEKAEDKALVLRLRDTVKHMIEKEMFEKAIDKLRSSSNKKITGDPGEVIKLTGKIYDINKDEQTGILRHLVEGGDLSKYALSNAVTRTSHDIENFDRATELQEIGWQVATMDSDLWNQVNGKGYLI